MPTNTTSTAAFDSWTAYFTIDPGHEAQTHFHTHLCGNIGSVTAMTLQVAAVDVVRARGEGITVLQFHSRLVRCQYIGVPVLHFVAGKAACKRNSICMGGRIKCLLHEN